MQPFSYRDSDTHAWQRKKTKCYLNANELGRCCTPGRTLYVQTVTINSAQPDFDIEISNCSCSVMCGHYNSTWCQMKEDELNFVTMKMIFYEWFNFSGEITALSGFLFIGTHCIFYFKKEKYTTWSCKHNLWLEILFRIVNLFCRKKRLTTWT